MNMSSSSTNPLHLPPPEYPSSAATTTTIGDPLANLASIRNRVDSLSQLLSNSVNSNTPLSPHTSHTISTELISAVHHIIINGAALITTSHVFPPPPQPPQNPNGSATANDADSDDDDHFNIVELDAVDLTTDNNSHTCTICGKTFKRDANLRMHMRAHGDKFKTLQSLSKPDNLKPHETTSYSRKTRFSCPCLGCNRNKNHKDFRPLKSVICVKNHFKRSHCPKKYRCNICNTKCFSVLSDLKSHTKQCSSGSRSGEDRTMMNMNDKWRCECGRVFPGKSELFEHMSEFEGHMPFADDDGDGFGLIENDQGGLDLWSSIEELIRF